MKQDILTQRQHGPGLRRYSEHRWKSVPRDNHVTIDTYTRRPGNLGSESSQGLDQDGGLNGPAEGKDICNNMTVIQTHMCRHPAIRAPDRGLEAPY